VFEGDDDIEAEDGIRYTWTPTEEWTQAYIEDGDDDGGRTIDPIEWTGADEVEAVNITDQELQLLRDANGETRFENVFEWALPRFCEDDSETLFEFQAARMQNFMTKRVADGWTPKYYTWDKVITADHVARFYSASLDKMLMGNRSIERIFCSREFFNAVPPIQAAMPKNALEDLTVCLHCKDHWDDIYDDPQVQADASMASHRVKHGILEDGYNRRWQAIVNPRKWITTDESRVTGWYHSAMTVGPEPKPIRTGATLHTVCITHGPLSTYKLFARGYGGRSDQDINKHSKNTVTKLKMVSLYDFMLESFKHKGHCVVMDSAYMGDAICQVGREVWGINMVGTCQTDRTGAGALGKVANGALQAVSSQICLD
jgi:hypothetical protein